MIYFESFEDDNGGYTDTYSWDGEELVPWEWGVPTSLVSSAADGIYCWATNLDGNYAIEHTMTLQSSSIDLTGIIPGTTLELWWMQACAIEAGNDEAFMQYSIDNGTSWYSIWTHSGTDFNTWHELNMDISDAAGHTLLLRWVLVSNGSVTEEGYYIDKIQIIAK